MRRDVGKEAAVLAKLYYDRMDVYRTRYVKNTDTGAMEKSESCMYQDVCCALSLSDKDAPDRGDVTSQVSNRHTLFASVDFLMEANDRVVVRTAAGQVYEGRTGRTFVLMSHGETDFFVERVS